MTEKPTIFEVLNRVMLDVTSVAKTDLNKHFGFNFRGIEKIMEATAPAFRKHGVIGPVPKLLSVEHLDSKAGGVVVTVEYTFIGPAGDSLTATVPGQQADTTKAMSVAERIALIQTLHIPTGERDPDSGPVMTTSRARLQVRGAAVNKDRGWDWERMAAEYTEWSTGAEIAGATDAELDKFLTSLEPKRTMQRGKP